MHQHSPIPCRFRPRARDVRCGICHESVFVHRFVRELCRLWLGILAYFPLFSPNPILFHPIVVQRVPPKRNTSHALTSANWTREVPIRSDPDSRSLNSPHAHILAPFLIASRDCASESFQIFSPRSPPPQTPAPVLRTSSTLSSAASNCSPRSNPWLGAETRSSSRGHLPP